jgi:hypothetical protein
MPARRLLFLDATGLTTYRWRGGHLDHEMDFAPDAAGLEAFGQYARKARSSIFYMLADVAEEGFQLDDVPAVRGGDRAALLQRKLSQYFYGTPYSLALSLGRAKEGRRDEQVLLAALTRPDQVEPWLAVMREAMSQLAGVYSAALVSPALLPLLGAHGPTFLLISITRAGLRQTLFANRQLQFSRLTSLATNSTEEMAVTCAAESERMYQYMSGQRLVPRDSQLTTLVLVHPAQISAFRETCVDTASLRFELVDLPTLSKKAELKTPPRDTRCEALFLHMLARRPPREQFAPAADRHHFRLGQVRVGLRATGMIVFATCLLFAGRYMLDYQEITEATATTAEQTTADRQRYESILQGLPKIPISNDALRAVVARYDALLRKSGGPGPLYVAISGALQEWPAIELQRLDWTLGGGSDDKPAAAASASKAAQAPASPLRVAPPPASIPFDAAEIHAQLPLALVSDHRAQLAAVDGFVASLRARGLEVQVLTTPFEAESSKVLRSGTASVAQAQAPQFSVRVARSAP